MPRGTTVVEKISIARALGCEVTAEIVREVSVKVWEFRIVRPLLTYLPYRLIAAIHEDVRAIVNRMTGIG